MHVNQQVCNGCGKCVAECHRRAISMDASDKCSIDRTLCNDCADVFDIECVRVCQLEAIVSDAGTPVPVDRTLRLRSEHLLFLMAVLGARGNGHFRNTREWNAFRQTISKAYLDPDLKVRLTKNFDDNCTGCRTKQACGHAEKMGELDDQCFDKLGIEPGTVLRLWDVVERAQERLSIPFLRMLGSLNDEVIKDLLDSCPRSAAVWTNE